MSHRDGGAGGARPSESCQGLLDIGGAWASGNGGGARGRRNGCATVPVHRRRPTRGDSSASLSDASGSGRSSSGCAGSAERGDPEGDVEDAGSTVPIRGGDAGGAAARRKGSAGQRLGPPHGR